MTTSRSHARTTAATAVLLAALGGCSAAPPTAPPADPIAAAGSAALDTYREFWRVTDAARANPRAKDWTLQIQAVAGGQALQTALTDVRNYASIPAHTVGTITRAPAVQDATSLQVSILDCVDIGATVLISDKDGARLDDTAHRVPRFRLRAEVVAAPDGRWLVDTTAPDLGQSC